MKLVQALQMPNGTYVVRNSLCNEFRILSFRDLIKQYGGVTFY